MLRTCSSALQRTNKSSVAHGQLLSLLVASTGIFGQYLALDGYLAPTLLNSINYLLLFAAFGHLIPSRSGWFQKCAILPCRRRQDVDQESIVEGGSNSEDETSISRSDSDDESSMPGPQLDTLDGGLHDTTPDRPSTSLSSQIPPSSGLDVEDTLQIDGNDSNPHWLVYPFLAFCDVQGNVLAVEAYQYTDITSVMLFDCFSIPTVMVLSKLLLATRYRNTHLLGVAMCITGLILTVVSDLLRNGTRDSNSSNKAYGDFLAASAAMFYAVANVGQELMVKQHREYEYLSMVGKYGAVISLLQVLVFERSLVSNSAWSWNIVGYMAGYVAVIFTMYYQTNKFLGNNDATVLNLSLLTSDVWAVVAGVLLFKEELNALYFVSFGTIIVGVVVYHIHPVPNKYVEDESLVADDIQTHSSSTSDEELLPPSTLAAV